MEVEKVLSIGRALSDELRIRILVTLESGEMRRYTDLMKILGLDIAEGSSKFAYHIGVLVEAGLIEKVDDHYRLTHGGNEILSSLDKVTCRWEKLEYQDSLRRKTGTNINKKIWSTILLWTSVNDLLYAFTFRPKGPSLITYSMIIAGFVFLALGFYWQLEIKEEFGDLKLERLQEAGKAMLGKNGVIISLIYVLGQLGSSGIVILMLFYGMGTIEIGLFSTLILVACSSSIVLGLYFSWRLSSLWDAFSHGDEMADVSSQGRIVFNVLMCVLLLIALWQIGYGFSISSSGIIGGGIGILGAFIGILRGYRKWS